VGPVVVGPVVVGPVVVGPVAAGRHPVGRSWPSRTPENNVTTCSQNFLRGAAINPRRSFFRTLG
jgi:hypothetical protein